MSLFAAVYLCNVCFHSGACILLVHEWMILQVRNWEERLQMTAGEDNVDKLCALAQDHMNLYQQRLPKPGV